MTLYALGDAAAVISLGDTLDATVVARVRVLADQLAKHPPAGVVDVVPAFASIALFFEASHAPGLEKLRSDLEGLMARADAAAVSVDVRTVELPVRYGGVDGPDLPEVAAHAKLSVEGVIAQHSGAEYTVHAIGFSPGFPYLGGLPERLATPRRATPRPLVPAGSVAIGGSQAGVYPSATPGGWKLIGRTSRKLFDVAAGGALLRVGDRVRFRAITGGEAGEGEPPEPSAAAGERMPGAEAAPRLEVIRAGMFTTVQDLGRTGFRASGMPLGGAADSFAFRVVNSLVGNPENAAGLEFTLVGPELRFSHAAVIALGGAAFGDLPQWRPFNVAAGTVLKLGAARSGCRGYLAVAGGIDVPPVLGSRSTYIRGQLGGFHGRALRDGDAVPFRAESRAIRDHWRIDERILPRYSPEPVVRVLPGPQLDEFSRDWTTMKFRMSSRSDRMGVRLTGGAMARTRTDDLVSFPVAPGTVQVPPDGHPIILLADAQTIGGYPQLAHVISVDLPLVAQLRPGDHLRLVPVSLADARGLVAAQERALALLREGLAQKLA